MKYLYTLFLCSLITTTILAQDQLRVPAKAIDRIRLNTIGGAFERFDEGTTFDIVGYQAAAGFGQINYRLERNGETYITSSKNVSEDIEIDYSKISLRDLWAVSYMQSEGLEQVAKHGWEPELRAEVEQEYLELEKNLEIYEDPLLQDYLNQLLMRVYPGELPERHTANLRVHLFNGSEPVTLGCSNGNIYLSTGLLSTLGSEAELMSMLAVEVAHIYFDHSVINYRKQEQREARAKFWTGLLTVAALAAETAVAVDAANEGNFDLIDYNFYGLFTESVFLLSSSVASAIISRLGMDYTREQQQEADRVAQLVLDWHGEDKNALATALRRIKDYYKSTREYTMYQDQMPYPHAVNRIIQSGGSLKSEVPEAETDYLRRCASLSFMSAWQEYREGEFELAQQLIDRQVAKGIASVDDQVLRSVLLRRETMDLGKVRQALVWLNEAGEKARAIPPELYMERAILHNRLGNTEIVRKELEAYR
ncbi:MAG TPA: M48 family metalloprotease, partial [Phaeodactylibacter sp.]|nr:M48 family metalloprotease [Phaeodactylibacter sp.]